MKFKISASLLSERLQVLSKVLPSKPVSPIMNYFLFQLDGDTLTVTATDGETTLVANVAVAEAQEGGCAALLAKSMDIVHQLGDQVVSFQVNDSNYQVVLTSDTGKFEFVGAPADEFPQHRSLSDNAVTLEASAQSLTAAIGQTAFAVAPNEDMRPIMGGIYFDATGEGLNVVATDAHKLARFHIDDATVSEPSGFVIPAKPAGVLRTLLSSEGDTRVSVRFDGGAVYCKTSRYWILTRQIEGKYPAYATVIPASNPTHVIIDRMLLLGAVKRVDLCANGANLMRFKVADGKLRVAAQDIDYSLAGEETLPCQYDGEEVEIGFKATLVKEALSVLASQDVEMQMSDSAHPGLFVPYQRQDGTDVLILLMPMMLP